MQSFSYTDGVSPGTLNRYRLAGFLVYYGTQFATRPWWIVRVVSNLLRHRQQSRLDKSLQDFVHRARGRRSTRQHVDRVIG